MAALQGFHEISLAAPASKAVMTITDSAIRFNKATAAELGYPSHVRVLVNESAKQVAIQACSADEENAVKFSKPADKQTGSVNIKAPAVLVTICSFFVLHNPSEDEIDYRTSNVPSSALWSEPAIVTASKSPTTTPRSCTMWSISTAAGIGITPNSFLFAG